MELIVRFRAAEIHQQDRAQFAVLPCSQVRLGWGPEQGPDGFGMARTGTM